MHEYTAAAGQFPSSFQMAGALRWEQDYEASLKFTAEDRREIYATEKMIRGALQCVASELLGQATQRRMGEHELFGGFRDLREQRDEARKAHEKQAKGNASKRRARKPPPWEKR